MIKEKPYFSIPIRENNDRLVSLDEEEFIFTSKYYKESSAGKRRVMLRGKVVRLLLEARRELSKSCRFKILDAWRSEQAQQGMFNRFIQEVKQRNPSWDNKQIHHEVLKFAAPVMHDPQKPPPHSTGGAVDLTIVDETGNELLMGKDPVNLSQESFVNFYNGRQSIVEQEFHENRQILRRILVSVGFAPNENEWWHFDYGNQRWAYYYKTLYADYRDVKSQLR